MSLLPEPLSRLIAELSKLPGIGQRSAERIALSILQRERSEIQHLAEALINAYDRVKHCELCGALTEVQPCEICSSPLRDPSILCVVEKPVDILNIEKTAVYRGKYHVLGGKISPLSGVEPEDLRIASLQQRLETEPIKEVVLALSADVEGDATCHYIAERLRQKGVKVSRIAHGLPAGGGLEFADQITLSRALEGRREI